MGDRLPQRGDREFRSHRGQPAAPKLLAGVADGQPAAVPHPVGDGGGGETALHTLLGEAVEVGVGGGVGGLAAAAPGGRVRGEQHERVQLRIPEQPVQVPRPEHLRGEHLVDGGDIEVPDHLGPLDAGGVEHGGDRVPGVAYLADQ